MSETNPLVARRSLKPAPEHPMMLHAKVFRHVSNMPMSDVRSKIKELDYALPVLGQLAGNPDVTPKDVIKAAADAAADGAIDPGQAVALISAMPPDDTKLQAWLKGIYAANLSAQVHMKAAQMMAAQPQAQAPQPGAQPRQPAPQAPGMPTT